LQYRARNSNRSGWKQAIILRCALTTTPRKAVEQPGSGSP
jgi:hypothetical protein